MKNVFRYAAIAVLIVPMAVVGFFALAYMLANGIGIDEDPRA